MSREAFLGLAILFSMIFFHITDDFFIQSAGFLARGKQKDWWKENTDDERYKDDYFVCLVMHSISWSFSIMLIPCIYTYFIHPERLLLCLIFFIVNAFIHCIVDDLKANYKLINLVVDQSIHLFQILITWIIIVAF